MVTKSVDTRNGEFSEHERKTMEAIGKASELPLSIVLVGVGDGPWDTMKQFDDSISSRLFDNFQFVNFSEIMSSKIPQSRKDVTFALRALMEIPSQYKATLQLGLLGAEERSNLPDPTADRWSEVGARVSPLVMVHKRARGDALFLLKDQTTGGTMERGADLEEKRNGELIGSIERVE
ncbi:E3 ubiquitin-protein ligase RGLG2-like protein [Carex littledalei]|uniref:E3 ubiquitin-protein ligase RGLG2-like protein n=1 Tax=Carex littledalei TaxID=544730 RepID=A0A833QPL8_9POAL|nr:E3 ubiquitin-protein ligase RGLG2-like protein [Carex littledalei]